MVLCFNHDKAENKSGMTEFPTYHLVIRVAIDHFAFLTFAKS